MNLSVGLLAGLEMYVWRDTSLFAAPARQTVVEMVRVALALEFALDQHGSSLVPSGVSTIAVDFCLFPDVHTLQLVCDDIDDVEHCFQDTLVLKIALVSIARLQPVPTSANQHPSFTKQCVDDVVIRFVDRWQVTSGFFLEPWQMRHPLSRSRSVTHVHMYRITQTV